MPIMDGIEATRQIKSYYKNKKDVFCPFIVAVSAAVQNIDKERYDNVGFDGYIEKPIIIKKLLNVLAPLVKKHKKSSNKI